MDVGTLYQLCNVINRRNVVKDVTNNVTACEDVLILTVEAHVTAAAMRVFNMTSIQDAPSANYFPEESSNLHSLQRRNIMLLAINHVLQEFVDLSYGKSSTDTCDQGHDSVHEYACSVLSSGLMYMEFADATL